MDNLPEESKYIIETQEGPICGYIDKSDEGTYYKFKSIPYAEPPLGRLRFLPPMVNKPWTDLRDCTQDAPLPLSFYLEEQIVGSEDCLYIEVSSPNVTPEVPLPVMFWIGSFNFIFYIDQILDPTLINNQDIVFVRCGFRLGPLGFLSVNDFAAPGNSGLKDIVFALRWVQRNISKFGGDPNNVTAFGSSTGGAIVHLLMLSPMAEGLFHKAIIQSSSALNGWSLGRNPAEGVVELAKQLNITKTDKIEIVEEMRTIPAEELIKAYGSCFKAGERLENDTFDSIFKPCIENDFEGQCVFLSKSPAIILKSGKFNKVPLIIGSNNIEASVLQYMKAGFYEDYEKFNKNVSLLVPKTLSNVNCDISKKIGQQILSFYFEGAESLNELTRKQYLQFLTDYYFLYYMDKTIRIHSQVAPECNIYYYVVHYGGEWYVPKILDFFNSIGHAGELPFLFRIKSGSPESSSSPQYYKGSRDSITTRNRVIKMWTNFAKYGNPTPTDNDDLLQITWDPVENENKLNFLSIGADLTKGRNPFYERMMFWEKLHQEHVILKIITHFNDMGLKF
ncbi:esterase FE4-like [Colias croceus]|uniref:esterase FE4-like n=1 Tax=Colias crocea TaxID=72248 RepID=UPI001E27D468|nr:esterase FE4-like [Colias croceus]